MVVWWRGMWGSGQVAHTIPHFFITESTKSLDFLCCQVVESGIRHSRGKMLFERGLVFRWQVYQPATHGIGGSLSSIANPQFG
jgi:hypothetical protein